MITGLEKKVEQTLCLINNKKNEITTTQTAPAAPVTSDQAVLSAPAQVSAPEALKAAAPTTPRC